MSLSHPDDKLRPAVSRRRARGVGHRYVSAALLAFGRMLGPDGGCDVMPSLEDLHSIRERASELWTDAISRAPCQHLWDSFLFFGIATQSMSYSYST